MLRSMMLDRIVEDMDGCGTGTEKYVFVATLYKKGYDMGRKAVTNEKNQVSGIQKKKKFTRQGA